MKVFFNLKINEKNNYMKEIMLSRLELIEKKVKNNKLEFNTYELISDVKKKLSEMGK